MIKNFPRHTTVASRLPQANSPQYLYKRNIFLKQKILKCRIYTKLRQKYQFCIDKTCILERDLCVFFLIFPVSIFSLNNNVKFSKYNTNVEPLVKRYSLILEA